MAYSSTTPQQQAGANSRAENTGRGSWRAVDSLKQNAQSSVCEETPLLAARADSSDSSDSRQPEWEGASDHVGLKWTKRPSLMWLLPAFYLFALAFGGIVVPKLNLILTLICREYLIERTDIHSGVSPVPISLEASNPQCRIPEVQALATQFTLWINVITGSLSAIVSPKLGAMSDRYGRTKMLTITSIGPLVGEIVTILAAKYPDSVPYQWILLGAVLDGVCGSFTAGMAITTAYAADCTPPPKRGVTFGYFQACLFGGLALGPLIAAALVKLSGSLITIFYCALGVHAVFILFIYFIVPESVTMKRQLQAREKYARDGEQLIRDGFGRLWHSGWNILAPLKILWPTGPGSSGRLRVNLVLLAAVDTITFGVAMGSLNVVVYYLGYKFDWDTAQSSAFMSVVSVFRVSVLLIVLPMIIRAVRSRHADRQRRDSGVVIPERNSGSDLLDLSIIRFSIGLEISGYTGYALAQRGSVFLLAGILAAMGGVGSPTLQGALTKHVPHAQVGQLLGATGMLHALGRVFCPVTINMIYAKTVKFLPQTVFVVLAGCFGVAFVVSWFIRPHVYLDDVAPEPEPQSNPPPIAVTEPVLAVVDEQPAAV